MSTDLLPDPVLAAHVAAEQPAMSVDTGTILVAAHRRARRRAVGHVGGGVVGIAAVAAVTVALVGGHATGTAQPAAPTFGTAPTVTLADGTVAVNRPGPWTAPDAHVLAFDATTTAVADLGIEQDGRRLTFLVGDLQDGTVGDVTYLSDPADGPVVAGAGAVWTWGQDGSGTYDVVEAAVGADGGAWFREPTSKTDRLDIAVAPADLPGARVLLWSESGFALAGGGHATAVELPTFASRDGHRVSAVRSTGAAAAALRTGAAGVAFVGSDGRVVLMPCDPAATDCPDPSDVPGLVDAIKALGGRAVG
jgi:hypothetical protein